MRPTERAGRSQRPSEAFEVAFAEPKAGPCHFDAVIHFSLTDASGSLLRIQGNPAQIRVTSELTFGTGFVYATFTLTNACELPQDAVGLFAAEGMVDRTFPATIASCPGATAPMALSASTRTNPNEH